MGDWYTSWFEDERYLCLYANRNDAEADQMIDLVESVTGADKSRAILDVPCGAGRHLFALAERGYTNLHGIDISHTLLEAGKKRAEEENIDIRFNHGDIREPLEGAYDIILNLFTSFGYFESDEEHQRVIDDFSLSLHHHGYCIIDFLNASLVRKNLVPEEEKSMATGEHVKITRGIDNGRVIKKMLFSQEGKEFIESVRLFTISDFREMFIASGLTITNLFGNYDGSNYTEESSPRLIMFARKNDQ